jgi:hypothetical protein
MSIFATPDFGASATMGVCVVVVWAFVLVLVLVGLVRGIRLLGSELPKSRKRGLLLVLVSGLVPFCCWLLPPQVVRIVYGNYPLGSYPNNKINQGMTTDEVEEILGKPHKRIKADDGEHWYYWIDSFDIYWFGVRFGPEGRVIGTHGN